ncbi:MAG: NAD-dependent dehydratase, partial [Actinomycetota bacterium]
VPYGQVPRDDVAAVIVRLLDDPSTAGLVLELTAAGSPPSGAAGT